MLTIPVYNPAGERIGEESIDPADFGGEINKQLLHDVVLMHLAARRVGTVNTRGRAVVAGSGKKLFRQKGTGNARVGTKRTNKRKGGGTAKGPKPRDYEYHMPKSAVRAATRMAILSKFQDAQAIIIDELTVPEIKTKQVADILKALKLDDTTCLIGTAERDVKVYKSARNIKGVDVAPAKEFNAYQVLKPKRLVLTRAALEKLRNG